MKSGPWACMTNIFFPLNYLSSPFSISVLFLASCPALDLSCTCQQGLSLVQSENKFLSDHSSVNVVLLDISTPEVEFVPVLQVDVAEEEGANKMDHHFTRSDYILPYLCVPEAIRRRAPPVGFTLPSWLLQTCSWGTKELWFLRQHCTIYLLKWFLDFDS